MSTHIEAKEGQIAKAVLLPGDPLRAKFIAENYLTNPKCFNEIRGMLGYTGTYKGVPVSVIVTEKRSVFNNLYKYFSFSNSRIFNLLSLSIYNFSINFEFSKVSSIFFDFWESKNSSFTSDQNLYGMTISTSGNVDIDDVSISTNNNTLKVEDIDWFDLIFTSSDYHKRQINVRLFKCNAQIITR